MTVVDLESPARRSSIALGVGCEVAVRTRYLGTWSDGFEIAAIHVDGYRIRRTSDGSVFADVIPFNDVREPLVSMPH
jgi:hypothetical protein